MPLKEVTKDGETEGVSFTWTALAVDGDVSLQDFIAQFNTDGIPMTYVPVTKGRAKDGETKETKGALNYLLEVFNLVRYREAVALNKPAESAEDKIVKNLVKVLKISESEARERVKTLGL